MEKRARQCINCSHWDSDFFDENRGLMAGFCIREKEKILLKYESQSCASHRFKRGAKSE